MRAKINKNKSDNKEDDFWEDGAFIESVNPQEIEEKMKTFHMKHNEDVNYKCKKCNKKISAHNRDWHDGMCDGCFDKTHYGKK